MLKISKEIKIDIEGSSFIFTKPTYKELLTWQEQMKQENFNRIEMFFSKLAKIENFQNESGVDVSPDELRKLDLPIDVVSKIAKAFDAELGKLMGVEQDPKKG